VSTGTAVDVEARAAIEAVVLAATEPVPPAVLAQLVELPTARVEELCDELAAEYEREGRGFQLARVAGGYRFQTHPDAHAYVERFVLEGQTARLEWPGAIEAKAFVLYSPTPDPAGGTDLKIGSCELVFYRRGREIGRAVARHGLRPEGTRIEIPAVVLGSAGSGGELREPRCAS